MQRPQSTGEPEVSASTFVVEAWEPAAGADGVERPNESRRAGHGLVACRPEAETLGQLVDDLRAQLVAGRKQGSDRPAQCGLRHGRRCGEPGQQSRPPADKQVLPRHSLCLSPHATAVGTSAA